MLSSFHCRGIFTARCTLVQSAVMWLHVVCLSVTLVDCDHIGWNSSKIVSWLVSLECSLSADPNKTGLLYAKGNTLKFGPRVTNPLLIWASESFDHKLRPNGYIYRNGHNGEPTGNHHRSFEWCNRWPLRPPLSPKIGVPYAPKIREWPYLRTGDPIHFMFGFRVGFSVSAYRMALFPVTSNPRWRQAEILDNFKWSYLRNGSFDPLIIAHGAVIFVIAQLLRTVDFSFVLYLQCLCYNLLHQVLIISEANVILVLLLLLELYIKLYLFALVISIQLQCWNWLKRTWGSAAEMFVILPRDWNLKPIFTQKGASVDMNWGDPQPPDNSNPVQLLSCKFVH